MSSCELEYPTYGRAHSDISCVALDSLREGEEDLFPSGASSRHEVSNPGTRNHVRKPGPCTRKGGKQIE